PRARIFSHARRSSSTRGASCRCAARSARTIGAVASIRLYLSLARTSRKPAALPGLGVPPRLTGPMSTHETLAARFARCVTLFRDPGARDDHKTEFRALLGLLKDAAVSLRAAERPEQPPPVASPDDVGSRETIIPRASRPTGTEGILRGEPWRDTKSVPIDGVPLVSHDPPPPPAADALPGTARPAAPTPS